MDSAERGLGTRTMRGGDARVGVAARRGFSLIEMVVVLLIIGMLVGAVAFNVLGQSEKAKIEVTKRNLTMIKGAIDTYMMSHNSPPTTLDLLVRTKILADRDFTDEWDRDFQYGIQMNNAERPFMLWSLGKDGMAGTEDDIDAWTLGKKSASNTR